MELALITHQGWGAIKPNQTKQNKTKPNIFNTLSRETDDLWDDIQTFINAKMSDTLYTLSTFTKIIHGIILL